MRISDDEPDKMLITEVLLKCQINSIAYALLNIDGNNCTSTFDPNTADLGQSGIRGVSIFRKTCKLKRLS